MTHPLRTPEAIPCHRHSDKTTRLRCTHCETPICPHCMIQTEVGFKCPDCIQQHASHVLKANPAQFVTALFVGVLAGYAYGFLHPMYVNLPIPYMGISLVGILLAFFSGRLLGQGINRLLRYKRHPMLITLMTLGYLLGLYLGPFQDVLLSIWNILPAMAAGDSGDMLSSGTSAIFSWIGILANLVFPFMLYHGLKQAFHTSA